MKREKEEIAARVLQTVREECRRRGIQPQMTVFSGDEFPVHPPLDSFRCDGLPVFRLGERLTFPAAPLEVRPQAKRFHHLLICGDNEPFKRGLLRSLLLSAEGSASIRQVFYIGERDLQGVGKPLRRFADLRSWVTECLNAGADSLNAGDSSNAGTDFSKVAHSLVILDQCNPASELDGYPQYLGASAEGEAKAFCDFLSGANKAECFCAAFYDRGYQITEGKLPTNEFNHALGYGLSKDDMNPLLGQGSYRVSDCPSNRAFYANNQKIEGWFRPYVQDGDGR